MLSRKRQVCVAISTESTFVMQKPSNNGAVILSRTDRTSSSNMPVSRLFVRTVIQIFSPTAYLSLGRCSFIISLAFGFSWIGTASSRSGTISEALAVTHLRSMRSWLPGTYSPEVMTFLNYLIKTIENHLLEVYRISLNTITSNLKISAIKNLLPLTRFLSSSKSFFSSRFA